MNQTNAFTYYTNSASKWTLEEDMQVREEYERGLGIIEIGNIHKRTPGGISARLKSLEIIANTQKVTGYLEYKESELYKEILLKGEKASYYAVYSPYSPDTSGIYNTWAEANQFIKGVSGVKHKKFDNINSATGWLEEFTSKPISKPSIPIVIKQTNQLFAGVEGNHATDSSTPEVPIPIPEPGPTLKDSLNEEQLIALNKICGGESIFLTGPGGSGKSYLLEALKQEFNRLGKVLAITALTGCAALLLGPKAKTLHSWAGIGLGKDSINDTIETIIKRKKKKNWVNTDCLVIDEIGRAHV